jgi:hypothetical protein
VPPVQNRIAEMVDADKEEGEVSEEEYGGHSLSQWPRPMSVPDKSFAALHGRGSDGLADLPTSKAMRKSFLIALNLSTVY